MKIFQYILWEYVCIYTVYKYGSHELIDILSSMSFSGDCKEVQWFEHTLMIMSYDEA
jgi:hypothetical protein